MVYMAYIERRRYSEFSSVYVLACCFPLMQRYTAPRYYLHIRVSLCGLEGSKTGASIIDLVLYTVLLYRTWSRRISEFDLRKATE